MKQNWLSRTIVSILLALAITACATSKPFGEWHNQSFSGELNNILIIGVTSRSTRRRLYEDKFVEALATLNIDAVPSYQLITSSLELSRGTIEAAIKRQNLDAVLITRLVGVKQEEVYREPVDYDHHRGYFGYYDHALQQTNTGFYAKYGVLTLETNLYDVASGELVWSMQSETMDASKPRHIIEEQIRLTINTLNERGLIRANP